jgi:hypothetical protein
MIAFVAAAHRVDMGEAVAREPFNLLRLLCSRQVEMKQPAGGGRGKQNQKTKHFFSTFLMFVPSQSSIGKNDRFKFK